MCVLHALQLGLHNCSIKEADQAKDPEMLMLAMEVCVCTFACDAVGMCLCTHMQLHFLTCMCLSIRVLVVHMCGCNSVAKCLGLFVLCLRVHCCFRPSLAFPRILYLRTATISHCIVPCRCLQLNEAFDDAESAEEAAALRARVESASSRRCKRFLSTP